MSLGSTLARVRRLAGKPPGYVLKRVAREGRMSADRFIAPWQAGWFTGSRLAAMAGEKDVDALWARLAARPYPAVTDATAMQEFAVRFPDAAARIIDRAAAAMAHRVDLLGTGPVDLGQTIDWLKDFKTGDRWPAAFCRSIDYTNRGRPSDVKVPWEISRLHWLLPVGQAYVLTGEARYAAAARDVLEQWMAANPVAWTVNWSCTMEPALRLLSWTWLFHVFAAAPEWDDRSFRARLLGMLYAHGLFTETHIERASVNGNHLTADAAGLVFAGLFFDGIGRAGNWLDEGWRTLQQEIALQVHPDGVDFEASSAYHRLVAELFLMAARYRLAAGLPVASAYADRLSAMGRFTRAYTRPDGSTPHWGDADDARALPLGTQPLWDHRYLPALIGLTFGDAELSAPWGAGDEIGWQAGLASLDAPATAPAAGSVAFPDGGVYILRGPDSHVFIDCGPVGLAGAGGHGHNDALSFEAWLGGGPLIVDPGSFVYTASFEDRNLFRSTAMHNTPLIDGAELNRFVAPDNLWNLHDDARPELLAFEPAAGGGRFVGRHSGYRRLAEPVEVSREIVLAGDRLTVTDMLSGTGTHEVSIPLHLAAGVEPQALGDGRWRLARNDGRAFILSFAADADFTAAIEASRVSPSYGVALPAKCLLWRARTALPLKTDLTIAPAADGEA